MPEINKISLRYLYIHFKVEPRESGNPVSTDEAEHPVPLSAAAAAAKHELQATAAVLICSLFSRHLNFHIPYVGR
jgi:hypothetical protein